MPDGQISTLEGRRGHRLDRLLAGLDLALAAGILALGLGWLAAGAALYWRSRRRITRGRRILYLGTGRIAQVFPRNGVNLFLERECSDFDGYFEQLWNVHFPAGTRGTLDLTPRHHLVDFDVEVPAALRPFKRTAMALRLVAFWHWLVPFAARNGISVVTATNPYLQGVCAAVVAFMLRLPYAVIVTSDYDWYWRALGKQAFPSVFPSRATEKRVERWVFRHAALVLADRRYYREYAVRNGADPRRSVATRVLADSAYEAARPDPSARARVGLGPGPLLFYVGRLDPDKLALELVDVLARVRQRFPDTQLACAGTGSLAEAMRDRARALGVEDGLRLLGTVPVEVLAPLLASSDAAVAGHMGYTLVEAGLAGVPIATYDYDYHGELLEDGVTGMLAPLHDVDALADRVCALLENPAWAAEMGARARQRLLREHSRSVVMPLYREAYHRVLGLPGGRGGRPARSAGPFLSDPRQGTRRPTGGQAARRPVLQTVVRIPGDVLHRARRAASELRAAVLTTIRPPRPRGRGE